MEYPRLVSWHYYDGRNIFSGKNEKEQLTEVWLTDPKGEDVAKNGVLPGMGIFEYFKYPYFEIKKKVGYTKRARKYGSMAFKMRNKYPELENAIKFDIGCNFLVYGDYVFVRLRFIGNSVLDEPFYYARHYIHKDMFDENVVKFLVEYIPRNIYGRVIEDYAKEEVPKLLSNLKANYRYVYDKFMALPDMEETYGSMATFVGKKAYVMTLDKGLVEFRGDSIGRKAWKWNGREMVQDIKLRGVESYKKVIVPNEDTVVIIRSDDMVTGKTKFAN